MNAEVALNKMKEEENANFCVSEFNDHVSFLCSNVCKLFFRKILLSMNFCKKKFSIFTNFEGGCVA